MRDLEPLKKALAAMPAVQLAVLFGSRARGRGGPRSDVDLGLILAPDSRAERLGIEATAGRAANREVDVVYLEEAPPLLRFQIARDGVVLVALNSRLWPRFKARAMVDWWDWAPAARKIHAAHIRRLREQVAHG